MEREREREREREAEGGRLSVCWQICRNSRGNVVFRHEGHSLHTARPSFVPPFDIFHHIISSHRSLSLSLSIYLSPLSLRRFAKASFLPDWDRSARLADGMDDCCPFHPPIPLKWTDAIGYNFSSCATSTSDSLRFARKTEHGHFSLQGYCCCLPLRSVVLPVCLS